MYIQISIKQLFSFVAVLCLTLIFAVSARVGWADTLAVDSAPQLISYQGNLRDGANQPFTGPAALQFTIYDAADGGNNLWTEIHGGVPVDNGNFALKLGAITPFPSDLFDGDSRYLKVGVDLTNTSSNFSDLPRQQMVSVPYALRANSVSWEGITDMPADFADGTDDGGDSSNSEKGLKLVTVGTTGDYATINEAMNAITPSAEQLYIVHVLPGTYTEKVTVKEYVHLRGSGTADTHITSDVNGNMNDAESATVVLSANSQLSDIYVSNVSTENDGVAVYVTFGNENTRLTNVLMKAIQGTGDRHVGLYLRSSTITVEKVRAEVEGASVGNWGVFNSASDTTFLGSTFTAKDGNSAAGIRINGGDLLIRSSDLRADNADAAYALDGSGGGAHDVRVYDSILIGEDLAARDANNFTIFIGSSLVEGGALAFDGTVRCAQSWDELFFEINENCN